MPGFGTRRDKLRRALSKQGADGILVTDFKNVTYLTGFTGDDSYLLMSKRQQWIISDPRYTTQLEEECPDVELVIRPPGEGMVAAIDRVARADKLKRLAFESDALSVTLHGQIAAGLNQTELIPTEGLVERQRLVKDRDELAAIRTAVRFAERGFDALRATLRGDQTEKQVAADLEHCLRQLGAKGCSFPPIVAVGPRAALPHAVPTDGHIDEAPFVLVDWGADEGLYKSDLTRVLMTGKVPKKLQRIYNIVLKAQLKAIDAIRPGVRCHDVDRVARSVISKAGFGPRFGHGLGHGIGLDIHEGPRLTKQAAQVLKPGMVVTVEPGIYLPGFGGVRIEDDVLVTRDGHEVLTSTAKEFDAMVI